MQNRLLCRHADVFAEMFVVDADSHWSEPADLFTSRAPAAVRDRVPQVEEVDGAAVVGVRRPPDRPLQRRRRHRARRHEGERPQGAVRVEPRRDPRRGVRPEGAPRGARRVRHRRPDHLPQHDRPRRPGPRHGRRRGALPHRGRDLQRRHGRDPGRLGRPAAAAADHAGVGRRHLRRRGQAGGGARGPRRQHDVGPARPRRARPRQPRLGPVLGGVHRAPAARALPHRRQRHRHDVLRQVPVGLAPPEHQARDRRARCCSSATPGS